MDVVRTIAPGKRGSIRYLKEWGDQLVAVRYRKNTKTNQMLTTIEIVVDQRPILPNVKSPKHFLKPQPHVDTKPQVETQPYTDAQLPVNAQEYVALKIYYKEIEYRNLIKNTGGAWSKKMKMWVTHRNIVERIGLVDRIVEGAVDMCEDVDLRSINSWAYI